jgi:hypothetical protein
LETVPGQRRSSGWWGQLGQCIAALVALSSSGTRAIVDRSPRRRRQRSMSRRRAGDTDVRWRRCALRGVGRLAELQTDHRAHQAQERHRHGQARLVFSRHRSKPSLPRVRFAAILPNVPALVLGVGQIQLPQIIHDDRAGSRTRVRAGRRRDAGPYPFLRLRQGGEIVRKKRRLWPEGFGCGCLRPFWGEQGTAKAAINRRTPNFGVRRFIAAFACRCLFQSGDKSPHSKKAHCNGTAQSWSAPAARAAPLFCWVYCRQ